MYHIVILLLPLRLMFKQFPNRTLCFIYKNVGEINKINLLSLSSSFK